MHAESSSGPMNRGDKVYVLSGAWKDARGRIVFIDYLLGTVTIALDEGPTHMIKTTTKNILRVIGNGDVV